MGSYYGVHVDLVLNDVVVDPTIPSFLTDPVNIYEHIYSEQGYYQ